MCTETFERGTGDCPLCSNPEYTAWMEGRKKNRWDYRIKAEFGGVRILSPRGSHVQLAKPYKSENLGLIKPGFMAAGCPVLYEMKEYFHCHFFECCIFFAPSDILGEKRGVHMEESMEA